MTVEQKQRMIFWVGMAIFVAIMLSATDPVRRAIGL